MNRDAIRQMELRLDAKMLRAARHGRRQRRQGAQWWFGQMRRVVNAAIEWRPSPPARPAQVYLELAAKRS
jgi:hypothetical protein